MEDRPRVRPVEAFPIQQEGKTYICLRDPQHFAQSLIVTPAGYFILAHFDGQHSLVDIQEAYAKKVQARPAFLRAKAIDEALIAEMQKV